MAGESFYDNTKALDVMKDIREPDKKKLNELLKIIREDESLGIYFYEDNKNGAWVRFLKEAGEFEELNKKEPTVLGQMKASYLLGVAEQKPAEVLQIVSGTDAKDPFIQRRFLELLLKLAERNPQVAPEAAALAKKYIEKRVERIWYFVAETAAKLMVEIAEKHPDKAFEIAEMLLEVWRSEDKKSFKDIVGKFDEYHYQEFIFKYYKKLWELDALRATKLLADIFDKALDELAKENEYAVESGFHIKIERLDEIGSRFERDIVVTIVHGVCEAGRVVIEKQPEKIDELFDYLEGLDKPIFERIVMYLLRFVPGGTQKKRISSIIGARKFLELPYWRYEYKLLLRDKFKEIDVSAKKVFTDWVEEQGLDKEDKERIAQWFREREGREATGQDFEEIENSRKARELYLVRNEFPELYERCKGKSRATDDELAPKPMIGVTRGVSPDEGSPISVEDMVKMEPEEAVEYLSDPTKWKMDKKKESVFHTPEEGLEGVFEKAVQQRIDDYAKLSAGELIELKTVFLKRYFHGAWNALREKKIKDKTIKRFLENGNYIVGKESGNQDYEGVFRSINYLVEGIFEDESLRKKSVKENGKEVWGIIEPLAKYAYNPDAIVGSDTDPHTECINCVQGEAFTLVVRFGFTCKNEDESNYERRWAEKVRGVLTYVLEKVKVAKVRCVFGVWFPQLYWLEEKWVSDSLDKIFDSGDDEKWDAVWGSYMSWGRVYKDVFALLAKSEKYGYAIDKLGKARKYKYSKDPEEGLVEHLMIGYFNGWIEFEDNLLVGFLEKAPAKLRAYAARFLTTGFKEIKGKHDEKGILERLKHHWEKRLEEIGKNPEENIEETTEFVGWVKDSPLDKGQTFELLYKTLELNKGEIGETGQVDDFVEGICEIAGGHELMALKCLNKAMSDQKMGMYFSLYKDILAKFMESILGMGDDYADIERIRKEAIKLADTYGRMHIYNFRGVYEKLIEKV